MLQSKLIRQFLENGVLDFLILRAKIPTEKAISEKLKLAIGNPAIPSFFDWYDQLFFPDVKFLPQPVLRQRNLRKISHYNFCALCTRRHL
jgi:hypothetical protein